jgi:hypothetical protein
MLRNNIGALQISGGTGEVSKLHLGWYCVKGEGERKMWLKRKLSLDGTEQTLTYRTERRRQILFGEQMISNIVQ